MHVFVTGGTGLIGTHLLRHLRERHDTVVLLSRRPAAARERIGPEDKVLEGDPMKPRPRVFPILRVISSAELHRWISLPRPA
jgi:uncharacterized protein YbjT (DUF2867 family)